MYYKVLFFINIFLLLCGCHHKDKDDDQSYPISEFNPNTIYQIPTLVNKKEVINTPIKFSSKNNVALVTPADIENERNQMLKDLK